MTALAALTLGIAATPSQAAPKYLYWANAGGGAGTTIGRATVDGTTVSDVRPSFIGGAAGPCMLATDSTHIYWANYTTNSIARAKLDGSDVQQNFITGADGPCGVAVDATHVFWTNSTGATLGRANINGTGVQHNFLDPANGLGPVSGVCGVAVDASLLYVGWLAAPNPVVTIATLAGGVGTSHFAPDQICGVAVNSTHVFIADWGGGSGTSISRMPVDFSAAPTTFISGLSGPCGPAVDDQHIYWANQTTNTIGQANLDGSRATTRLISAGSSPCGVALSPGPPAGAGPDTDPPQTTIDKAPKKKTKKRKVTFGFSSNESRSRFECALNGASFQACTSPHKVKGRRGKNNFQVRATDAAGNVDGSPALQSWKRKRKRRN